MGDGLKVVAIAQQASGDLHGPHGLASGPQPDTTAHITPLRISEQLMTQSP
jgi:hypothetical protein